jgi:enoyl-CoA hydratase
VALGGGLELALVADLLVAASDATFGSPEVRFGLFPGGGALLKLPRTMPLAVVTRLALTGQPITARTALEHGLVVEVTEPGGALAAAMDLAGMIARNAPLGVQAGKRLLRESPGLTENELWAAQLELINTVFTSEDAGEGARSFAEKRSPEWRGR